MTDQPSTQEGRLPEPSRPDPREPETVGRKPSKLPKVADDQPSTQEREHIHRFGEHGTCECGETPTPSTTQEAEKALEDLWQLVRFGPGNEALAALGSLRTQHTKQQERIELLEDALSMYQAGAVQHVTIEKYASDALAEAASVAEARVVELQLQHTKDQERIEAVRGHVDACNAVHCRDIIRPLVEDR